MRDVLVIDGIRYESVLPSASRGHGDVSERRRRGELLSKGGGGKKSKVIERSMRADSGVEFDDGTVSWQEALVLIGCRGSSKDTFKRITTEGAVAGSTRVVLATVPRPGGHRVKREAITAFIAAFERAASRERKGGGGAGGEGSRGMDVVG